MSVEGKVDDVTAEGRSLREVLKACGFVFDHPLLREVVKEAPSAHKADEAIVSLGWSNALAKQVNASTKAHLANKGNQLWDQQILPTGVRPAEAMLVFPESPADFVSCPFKSQLIAQSKFRMSPEDTVSCEGRPFLLRELGSKDHKGMWTTLDGDGKRHLTKQNVRGGLATVLSYTHSCREVYDCFVWKAGAWWFYPKEQKDPRAAFPDLTVDLQSLIWSSQWPPLYCKMVTIESQFDYQLPGFERITVLANLSFGPRGPLNSWFGCLLYEKILIINGNLRPGYGRARVASVRGMYEIRPGWNLRLEQDTHNSLCIRVYEENLGQYYETIRTVEAQVKELTPSLVALSNRSPRPLEQICGLGLFQRSPAELKSLQELLLEP